MMVEADQIANLVADACADLARQIMAEGYEGQHFIAAFNRLRGVVVRAVTSAVAAPKMNDQAKVVRVNAARPERAVPVAMVITSPPANAKAIARKAIAQSRLAPAAIAVGSQLIEHFNLDTGRCDPGIASLAAKAKVSQRTARRSIATLVAASLFGVVLHGGRAHANAYQPNWPELMRLASEVDLTRPMLSADPANVVPQNHLQKPDSDSMVRIERRRRSAQPIPGQIPMMLPIAGGGRAVAEDAARKRLREGLEAVLIPMGRKHHADGLHRSMSVDWGPSIAAEVRAKGSGLTLLLEAIGNVPDGAKRVG